MKREIDSHLICYKFNCRKKFVMMILNLFLRNKGYEAASNPLLTPYILQDITMDTLNIQVNLHTINTTQEILFKSYIY